jgi:hypothetical protein
MYLGKILLIFSVMLIGNNLIGQKLSIKTNIDTNKIAIGDQVALTYTFLKDKNIKLQYPVFGQNLIEKIEIIGRPRVDSANTKGPLMQVSVKLIITSFDTGIYYIPPQPFVVFNSGISDTVFSKATYLEVIGVAIDTTGTIRDIKAPEKVPITFLELLPYLAILGIGVLIGVALIWYFKKSKKDGHELQTLKPSEPSYITALRELDKIKAQKLWQQKEVKEYYTRLTFVIRWYISKRFAILALEQTSDEILDHIKSLKLDQVNYKNLEDLLNLADIVKFAKGEPDPNENIIHLDNAYEFVKMTKEEISEESLENQPGNNNI